MPLALRTILEASLAEDPSERKLFAELFEILISEDGQVIGNLSIIEEVNSKSKDTERDYELHDSRSSHAVEALRFYDSSAASYV
ncbi:MAG: hypothetical protein SGCHY_005425 [Lobulomycetales sp.]